MSDESDIENGSEDGVEDGVADESPFLNSFIDAEAVESDEFDEPDEFDDGEPTAVFSQFMNLPPELRERVWEFFVPDLKANRVLRLLHISHLADELWEVSLLPQQTAPARAMLATHTESRAIGLRNYPDTIDIRGGRGILRFHSERDVILLDAPLKAPHSPDRFVSLFSNVKYLAVDSGYCVPDYSMALDSLPPALLQNLKAVFLCLDPFVHSKSELGWCASDSAHRYSAREIEGRDEGDDFYYSMRTVIKYLYCWPDLQKTLASENGHPPPLMDYLGVPIWPMVEFHFDRGLSRYQKICDFVSRAGGLEELDDLSSSDSGEGSTSDRSTEDEYESEGIDDATIDNDSDATGDEDDLVIQSGSEEEVEYEDEEQDVSAFNGFSPLQEEEEGPELHLGDEVGVANFSSLEPESPNHDGNESSSDISDEEPVQKTVRQKRRIVVSDDEHDSEEEGDRMPSRPAKRSRIVISDTEDEDDDDGDQVAEVHAHHSVDESEDDEVGEEEVEDPDETEDEEPVKAKPMSIFDKLRQYRDENPVPQGSDDESHTEGPISPDEFDGGNDARFPDDEAIDELDPVDPDGAVMEEYSEGEGEEEW
ncbi:hypothetical protein F4820DRAFT_405374 [Hypoxylon rubiginosum]|uniref:Uncharacterized protein n=1 Tax=Hypoxylon rubiginosum TaxID=110542 RepID=A0ACB9ZE82_9PEZI|nr:hypothetical protein F4820DRAFT_405374 [Hypoxylon rubiginosum]